VSVVNGTYDRLWFRNGRADSGWSATTMNGSRLEGPSSDAISASPGGGPTEISTTWQSRVPVSVVAGP
jgi:hypothetical protein